MKIKSLIQQDGPTVAALTHDLEVERRKVSALAGARQGAVKVVKTNKNTFKFALYGDTHVGSLWCAYPEWQAFYEFAEEQGVEDFYHCGDVLSGFRVFRGHEFEVKDLGLDKQLERFAEKAPRIGKTHFITGNHDLSYKVGAGASVGKSISELRPDWTFLGDEQARITYKAGGQDFNIMLQHPGGGTAYAISYKIQKAIESLEGGTKPNIIAQGHYHKAEWLPCYRNICGFQTGTFEWQTPFEARQGIAAHVGGWIVEVAVGNKWNSVTANFLAFYR